MKMTLKRSFATGFIFAICASAAHAQAWPDGGGRGWMSERDPVTGYQCVTDNCDVVRINEANCICTKDNPAEQRLSDLKLSCFAREAGKWIACPVKPRFGR